MVSTKSEMITKFEEILDKNFDKFKETSQNETNLIKTYLIENHLFKNDENKNDNISTFLNDWILNLEKSPSKSEWNLKIRSTNDLNLIILDSKFGEIFIDITDTRFWSINTAIKAKSSDMVFNELLREESMDNIWLPSSFINSMNMFGSIYGIGVSYNEILNDDENIVSSYLSNEDKLKLKIRKFNASKMLKILQQSEFKENIALDRISILKTDSLKDDDFIVDDITYFGKFTAKGTSYSKHSQLVYEIFSNYRDKLQFLEDNIAFNFNLDEQQIKGQIINIKFHRKDIILSKLVDVLSSGNKVFKLWGIPKWSSEEYCSLKVVDLHVGNLGKSMELDITPNNIRVIFPHGACANTLARLLTNIHQNIDATAELITGGNPYDYFILNESD